ncbi:hypothetical protein AB6B38_05175 [Glycocaulis abyssi]|uniref:DUF2783 domain-containing protein n=1 Tax=Glycocaulis abyssi TaxID=1433403 RepID=A0ABV9NAI4_9PROT
MKNDPTDLPAGASSNLVADYLIDLLRSMAALADAAELEQSKLAIDRALDAVLSEKDAGGSGRIASAG